MSRFSLDIKTESLAKTVVHCAYLVHRNLGPGLLEKVYELGMFYEIQNLGIVVDKQKRVDVQYKDLIIQEAMRLDLLVDNRIICEIKSAENYNPVWEAQLLTYLKLTDTRLGFLINFNVVKIKDGIKRLIR